MANITTMHLNFPELFIVVSFIQIMSFLMTSRLHQHYTVMWS